MLNNISVIFDKQTALQRVALDHVSLAMRPGDFITIIGSNGAGKSTLLKLIAGEVRPAHGKIFFDSIDVTHVSVEERAAYIGHVYQDPRLGTCVDFTVEENLAFAAERGKQRGLRLACNRKMRSLYRALLKGAALGLENRLSDKAMTLSGGQRQALSLMMATFQLPKILLLDEHTAALDPKTAKNILAVTKKIVADHHITTLMVTHHLLHALNMGNRTILMQEGKIIRDFDEATRAKIKPEEMIEYF